MKNLFNLFATLISITLVSCDYVKNPKQATTSSGNGPAGNITVRKVLLEDYTGQTCGNCPAAATKADEVQTLFGNNVIVLAVHAGFFAEPSATGTYTTDYTTTAGDAWDTFFGISAAGNPNGMINRKDYPSSTHIKNHNSWPTEVSALMNQPADAKLTISPNYNSSNRTLNVDVKTKFLNPLSNNHKLSVVLVEDSLVSPQKDYSQNPSTIYNFVFKHVLRGSLNGDFGDVLNSAPVFANDSITKSISNYSVPANYKDNKLYVLAFIYNSSTYEIIQTEQVKIK
jgi:thiol-disulfide isomerase/thioredoxin